MTLSRRQFLIRTGVATGGLVALSSCGLVPVLPTFATPESGDAFSWVQLTPTGEVLFYCPRSEMGQGIASSFTRLVAQEMTMDAAAVQCRFPDTNSIPPAKMTVGSESVEAFAKPLAIAAASLREALRRRGAASLGCQPGAASVENGQVVCGSESITFAALVAGEAFELVADTEQSPALLSDTVPPPAKPEAHAFRAIVTGEESYSRDGFVEGMKFGAVAHPPWLGAKLESFTRAAALDTAGVLNVVEGPNGQVGVVAETPMAARLGVDALACQWETLSAARQAEIDELNDVDRAISGSGFEHAPVDNGDVSAGRQASAHEIDVRYDSPLTAHASMEPRAGVAIPQGDQMKVLTGSQDPWYVQGAAARAAGLSRDNVVVQNHRLGGGFGGRIDCGASIEAAWLAKAAGVPVKVQWSREDEFRLNYAGPGFSHRIQAGVTSDGMISHWQHFMVGSPILTTSALIPEHLQWAADLVPDPGTWRGAETSYRIANHRVDFSDVRRPMPTGAWRGLGAAPNTYAVECAMDELALAAGLDPITFRIRNAMDPRLAGVLEELQGMVPTDRHLGIAAGAYKGVTFVAVAAEVDADGTLKELWCVHDCGRMINPDRVKAQVEGCLVWGVGMALQEALVVENGTVSTDNYHRYRVPRIDDVPPMQIALVESGARSSGAGEAAFPPATAAIVNACARVQPRQRGLPLS